MPVRIDLEYLRCVEEAFFASQYASDATQTSKLLSVSSFIQDVQECCALKFPLSPSLSPTEAALTEALSPYRAVSPATSTTASDHQPNSADRDYREYHDRFVAFKDCDDRYDTENRDNACFIPYVDRRDWDEDADGARRFAITSELVEVLGNHGGRLLLSKFGSVLTDDARLALRELRIRLLTFLKEKPQKKYFRIEGAGGGQVLILRDLLRDPAPRDDIQSLDAVRAELFEILAPCRRKNALLLRAVGSSLSHSAKSTLKVNRLSVSQFLALDKRFVVRKSHVYLAEPDAP